MAASLFFEMPKSAKRGAKVGGKPTLQEPLKSRAQALAKFVCDEKFEGKPTWMARGMRVSQPTVSNWVNGVSSPTMQNLQQLATMAHVKFQDWLEGKEPQPLT